eukprot:5132668-Amphidinium_carterae.2
MEVWAALDHRLHDLAVARRHHKVVRIFPADVTPGGPETSGLWAPPQAVTQRAQMPDRATSSSALGSVRPLRLRRWPKLAIEQGSLPCPYSVEIKGDLRVSLESAFQSEFEFRSSPELRPPS